MIQFHGELTRQLKSRDKAVDGAFFCHQTLGIHNSQYQPPLRLFQYFDQCLVAFFHFPLLLRKLGWGIEAIEENTIFVSDAHLKYAKPYALKTILDSL